ncbi:MAG: hypothetical protein ACM3XR_12485 [Bacillota bacterium]
MRSDLFVRIESERALAEKYGISKISMPAAIKNLINEGLLIQLQVKGTYITLRVGTDTLHVALSPDIKGNDPFYNNLLAEITNIAERKSIRQVLGANDERRRKESM